MSQNAKLLVLALRLLGLALIGLHLLAPHLSEETAWGVWPFTYLPLPWRWGLGLGAAALVLWGEGIWRYVGDGLGRPWKRVPWSAAGTRLALAAAAALPFWLFRIRHLRWGDAYILAKAIPHPEVRLTYVWQAPLDVYLHARLWQLANRWLGWPDPVPVYWIISALAGVAFVWTLLGLAHWLGRDSTERILISGLILTLGTMQLFFGYIENYSIMTVGVVVYAWLALRALRGEIGPVWPATALAITHAFHPSTIILGPSLLYLTLMVCRGAGQNGGRAGDNVTRQRSARAVNPAQHQVMPPSCRQALLSIAVPYAVVFAAVVVLMTAGNHGLDALMGVDFPGGGDRKWFVPLFQVTTEWQHYTMFSWGHLVDIVNQQLMSAPVVWPGLLLLALLAHARIPWQDRTFRLLAVMACSYLLLTLIWNADYGGQRDWDLFSPAAVPAALLLAYTLPRAMPEKWMLRAAAWALITTQAVHTAAWIYQNTLPLPYPP